MKKQPILIVLILLLSGLMHAQQLLTPSYSFSHKKTAYLTLSDGSEMQGTIKKIKRKKGLIEEMKFIDGSGEKHKFDPAEISFMYLPPSGFDKLGKALNTIYDAQKWNDEKLDQDLLNQGYVYFEMSDVKIKKKTKKLLMQLLNPSYSKYVKVYHDPFAKETTSIGIAGIDVAGGDAKSYYIAKGDNPAFRLKKKHYDEEFKPLWGSCESLIEKFPDKRWKNLTEHVITYSKCMKE